MSGGRILLVEDEWLILQVAATELADAGYEVLSADNGDSALALLERGEQVDLLFTDVRMPGSLDGWALARRARDLRPDLPVIYATGFSREAPGMVDGAVLVDKPYRLPELLTTIDRLLGRSG